jgi:hypothetical protein
MAKMETLDSAVAESLAWSEPATAYSDTTRQLCGAVELNPSFARQVLEVLDDAGCKAIASSPGVDLVPVLGHALASRRRRIVRDVVLLGVFAVTVILAAASSAAASSTLGALGLVAAFVVTFLSAWQGYRAVRRLRRGEYDHAAEPPAITQHDQAFALSQAQNGNVSVYSGFSPFVGSGAPVGAWSFALDLTRKSDRGIADFQLGDLYTGIEAELGDLQGVEVERRLFIDGRDVRADGRFLRDPVSRPYTRVPESVLAEIREEPETTVRYLTCVRVVDWQGDLVISAFVRLTRVARTLYVEVTYTLLPPVKESLRGTDALRRDRRMETISKLVLRSLATALVRMPLSPLFVSGHVLERLQRRGQRKQLRREIERAASYDYGATQGVRELAAEGYRRYFQVLDKEMYLKVVERRLLDGLVRFLDEKDVDTSELKKREEAILNHGVIISGGDVKFENTNIGQKAQLTVNRTVGAAKAATA